MSIGVLLERGEGGTARDRKVELLEEGGERLRAVPGFQPFDQGDERRLRLTGEDGVGPVRQEVLGVQGRIETVEDDGAPGMHGAHALGDLDPEPERRVHRHRDQSVEEVTDLDPRQIRYDNPRVESAAQNISDTVLEVYGPNSPEYRRLRRYRIWHGDMYVNMPDEALQEGFAEGIPHTIETLENLVSRLEETKADFGADAVSRVREAFQDLDLHPRIADISADLYRDGHYRDAVLDAAVALVNMVREKSRKHDLDGAPLMTTVFSKNAPVLAFNDLNDRTGA